MNENQLSKAERTKQYIVEKTAPVFNEKGFAGTSLNDLISATGLSKGSIYGNFQDKDEVALAAFDYNFGKVVAYLRSKTVSRSNAVDKLLVYPETYRNFLSIPFLKPGCPVLNTSTEADDTHPALRERALAALKLWKSAIESHINKGIAQGEIREDADPKEFAVVLISLIEGAVMQCKVSGRSTDLRIAMNFLEKLILGLRP